MVFARRDAKKGLGELNRFQEYYCDLVRHGIRKAEVSRVVVDADYRRLGFGEVIVDTLCSLASVHAIRLQGAEEWAYEFAGSR